jgi:hypothetical protein
MINNIVRNEFAQFNWNWVDIAEGYEGIMDDNGTFVPEWVIENTHFMFNGYVYLEEVDDNVEHR